MTLPARRLPRDLPALEALLRDGLVRRAKALEPAAPRALSTGVPLLDAALGGGFVRGQLHELVGPPGAGGTALLRAALAAATAAGELCALIDPADSFDPRAPGFDLRRLLWVRPADALQALRAAELALEARFALVALDLGEAFAAAPRPKPLRGEVEVVRFERRRPSAGASPWARLARRAEKHGGALVVLSRSPQAGTFATALVELERGAVQWDGDAGAPGRLLRGASSSVAVRRHKRLPPSGALPLSLPVPRSAP